MCKIRNALGEDDWSGLYEKAIRCCLGLKSHLIVILLFIDVIFNVKRNVLDFVMPSLYS
jgi:hypothetical protein